MTVDDVARELMCSTPKISRIETGTRLPTLRDVRDLCRLYRLDDAEQAQLMTIAREAKQQGWWNKFDDLGIDSLIGLETEAKQISAHDSSFVPWAFQTEEYARAIIKGIYPRIDDRVLDERVIARMTRQELLRRVEPPYLWTLIDESALRRAVGGARLMRDQLSKILETADTSNVTMQVVPFEAGAHPGLDNTFMLLEFDSSVQSSFDSPIQSPVVFVENLAGNFYLERDSEIQRYREVLEHLRACALSPAKSVKYVAEIRKTHEELSKRASKVLLYPSERKSNVSSFEPSLPDIPWRTAVKSSGGDCVQVARRDGVIMVTHSKRPGGPTIAYTIQEFDAFLDGAKKGEFDDFLN